MIAFAKPPKVESSRSKNWYILIAKEPNGSHRWDAVFEDQYDFYQKKFIIEGDWEIIAGPYSVSEKVLDKIIGYNSKGQEIGEKHLEELVRRLNQNEEINPIYELEKLIKL